MGMGCPGCIGLRLVCSQTRPCCAVGHVPRVGYLIPATSIVALTTVHVRERTKMTVVCNILDCYCCTCLGEGEPQGCDLSKLGVA